MRGNDVIRRIATTPNMRPRSTASRGRCSPGALAAFPILERANSRRIQVLASAFDATRVYRQESSSCLASASPRIATSFPRDCPQQGRRSLIVTDRRDPAADPVNQAAGGPFAMAPVIVPQAPRLPLECRSTSSNLIPRSSDHTVCGPNITIQRHAREVTRAYQEAVPHRVRSCFRASHDLQLQGLHPRIDGSLPIRTGTEEQ